MDIGSAIQLLCEVHTRDVPEIGFEVIMGATPDWHAHGNDYVEAWAALRRAVEMPVDPPDSEEST